MRPKPGRLSFPKSTRDLIGTTFELADLGSRTLKGYDEPVPVWRVVGERHDADQFEATNAGASTQMVGRETGKLALLRDRWELAKDGEGQVVLLAGEAGIGKSKIVDAVRTLAGDDQCCYLHYQCSPLHTNSAFHPVIQHLERAAGFGTDDDDASKFEKLEQFISVCEADTQTVMQLFCVPCCRSMVQDRYGSTDLSPEQRRDRTFAALVGQVLALAQRRPVLLVMEDAHWIDPTTHDYIGEVIAQITGAAVFVLITHRPDFDAPWQGHPHLTALTLNRLSRAQSSEIVETIGEGRLAGSVVEHIVARADGVPLFVEELTKLILQTGGRSNNPVALEAIPVYAPGIAHRTSGSTRRGQAYCPDCRGHRARVFHTT